MSATLASDAILSDDGVYRYLLRRWWDPTVEAAKFIMLNPSTADASQDDPTIRRCMGFARRWGMGGLVVANLYALRSTDPRALWDHPDPVGPENDGYLRDILASPGPVIAAWGAHAKPDRVAEFFDLAGDRSVLALGRTKAGQPRHPLYLRSDLDPAPYRGTVAVR